MVICVVQVAHASGEVQFNTDVLDIGDRSRVDLSQFSHAGFIMPGTYMLTPEINKSTLPERQIAFMAPEGRPKESEACLPPEVVGQMGLTASAVEKVAWWHNGECLDPASLPGMALRGDLGEGVLHIMIPRAYLEYAADDWDPPARWDEGVSGVLFDYNMNAQETHQYRAVGNDARSLTGNGIAGVNLGPWRLRADWQAQYEPSYGGRAARHWDWSRYYAYRAISALRARLTMGERELDSDMFDSFSYAGAGLVSDDSMLPPNLRGYAPEVTGVAKTNATVTISQQGRVIYETTVAPGPFRIQDLDDSVSGRLEVRIREQDGTVRTFQVNTASIPYLTRPGMVRYKLALGRPSDYDHHGLGPEFATGELSWGIDNGWSLFGGSLLAGDYNALATGVGRDLLALGALSFDVTQSRARLTHGGTRQGASYRLSYSKRFDATGSAVTFAGYRFSERDFMSMSQYLAARAEGRYTGGSGRELYTLSFSQVFRDLEASAYLTYSHQTWWDRPTADNWVLNLSKYATVGAFRGVSVNLSAYRSASRGRHDTGVSVSISVPWGNNGRFSYDGSVSQGQVSHSLGYSGEIDRNNSYSLTASGSGDSHAGVSGYLSHTGSLADMSASLSAEEGGYSAAGMSLRGGLTATLHGMALHRVGTMGGTRVMVDTGGVSGVPVRGAGGSTRSNAFGKAVVSDIGSYYRNTISVDLDHLSDNVDVTNSVIQDTLTEGAIGYRRFAVITGQKAMATVTLADGSTPPFGATVMGSNNVQAGMLSDSGSVWLTGINPGEKMTVNWDGRAQCAITLPPRLPSGRLLLPCNTVATD